MVKACYLTLGVGFLAFSIFMLQGWLTIGLAEGNFFGVKGILRLQDNERLWSAGNTPLLIFAYLLRLTPFFSVITTVLSIIIIRNLIKGNKSFFVPIMLIATVLSIWQFMYFSIYFFS